MHALHLTMQISLYIRVRLAFQKPLQTRQTSRNSKKLSKTGLVVIKHCLGNSQINSQKREQTQKLTSITVARADIIYKQRQIEI